MFDYEKLLAALQTTGDLNIPIFVGILPLASHRNAEFYQNEVPGMDVPADVMERMRLASEQGKEFAIQQGIEIARESLAAMAAYVQGAYIMPPMGKVEMAIETAAILPGRAGMEKVQEIALDKA